jgi:hypothetical protein
LTNEIEDLNARFRQASRLFDVVEEQLDEPRATSSRHQSPMPPPRNPIKVPDTFYCPSLLDSDDQGA